MFERKKLTNSKYREELDSAQPCISFKRHILTCLGIILLLPNPLLKVPQSQHLNVKPAVSPAEVAAVISIIAFLWKLVNSLTL